MVNMLSWNKMTEDEQSLAQFVQGILNRKGVKVFIDVDNYKSYLKEDVAEIDLWELIKLNISAFNGAVCYDLNCNDVSVNMAAMISAATDALGVPRTLINKINKLGLPTVRDLAEISGSNAVRQRIVWDEVKNSLTKTALVHQVVKPDNFHLTLRDAAIYHRWACIYTGESDEDRRFRHEVLKWLNTNVPIYGWNDDEIAFIKDISTYGDYAVPSDWSCNHSYFGNDNVRQLKQRTPRTQIAPNKHYVAFVVSDGDNVQWLERNFAHDSTFGQRQRSPMNYKMSWTFSPSLTKLCPEAAEYIYSFNKNDYFITGVSGIGYANCLSYPREYLDEFTRLTSEAMEESDLQVVGLLDYLPLTENDEFVKDRLSSYTKYDNIIGGIWELDPDHYRGGHGKIFWSQGKPFISVRFSLWHFSGDPEQVTTDFLDEFAEMVNAMPVAPDREEGYTVINVHPWSIQVKDIDYVVSKLGDHIELVYADELIQLVKNNLPSK